MKKRNIAAIVFIILSIFPFKAFAADITVKVDGTPVTFTDAKPFIDENNRTLVPMRIIGVALGMNVDWSDAEKKATFIKKYDETNSRIKDYSSGQYLQHEQITFIVGSNVAEYRQVWTGGEYNSNKTVSETIDMDTALILKDSRSYAPVSYLASSFGCNVAWDSASNSVLITTPKSGNHSSYENSENNDVCELQKNGIIEYIGAQYENNFGMYYVAEKGTEVSKIEFKNVKLDGNNATTTVFGEEMLLKLMKETANDTIVAAIKIEGDYKKGSSHVFSIEYIITFKDGTTKLVTEEYLWNVESFGGFM